VGRAKEKASEDEAKREVAIEIGVRVGLLLRCEDHHYVMDNLQDNFEDAYRLANSLITQNDPLVAIFNGNRRELTDLIKTITHDFGESCPGCDARNKE
jgi:hypothetical protein